MLYMEKIIQLNLGIFQHHDQKPTFPARCGSQITTVFGGAIHVRLLEASGCRKGEPWENHGKIMGKSWENPRCTRNFMGIWWELNGT